MIFCRRHRGRCLLFFCCAPITIKEDALYFSAEVPQRAEGERPGAQTVSDGRPCSGVRGDQQVSTASYSSCAGSGTGCGLFAEALYGFIPAGLGKSPLYEKTLCKKSWRYGMLRAPGAWWAAYSASHMFGSSNLHPSSAFSMTCAGSCLARGGAWA